MEYHAHSPAVDAVESEVVDKLDSLCEYPIHPLSTVCDTNPDSSQQSSELNEEVLDSTLSELPQLLGLHIVGCSKVTHFAVFRLVSHTPRLESLAFTATVR